MNAISYIVDIVYARLPPLGRTSMVKSTLTQALEDQIVPIVDMILENLADTEEMSIRWGVGHRQAQKHCANIHREYGVGWKIGRTWHLLRKDIETYKPKAPGRPPSEESER